MSSRKPFLVGITLLFTSSLCFAIDQAACSKLLNNGLYKTYKYGGIDQPLTKATKDHGISKSTSVTSTEGSTASLDPKYWSNVTTSETQSTSSWGPCNAIGMNDADIKRNRALYIVQNKDEVIKEIAQGGGEHLKVLATFSLCDKSAYDSFSKTLQVGTAQFIEMKDDMSLGNIIDQKIKENRDLSVSCHAYNI